MRGITIKDAVIIEINDPKAPISQTVGHTNKGVPIIKVNRFAVKKAAQKARVRLKEMELSA